MNNPWGFEPPLEHLLLQGQTALERFGNSLPGVPFAFAFSYANGMGRDEKRQSCARDFRPNRRDFRLDCSVT